MKKTAEEIANGRQIQPVEKEPEICSETCSCKSGHECDADKVLRYIDIHESERSWKEDFSYENGEYMNKCTECDRLFVGHKRRITCKKCDTVEKEPETVESPISSRQYIEQFYGTSTFARSIECKDAESLMDMMDDFLDWGVKKQQEASR